MAKKKANISVLEEFPSYDITSDGRILRVRGKPPHREIQTHNGHPYGYLKVKLTDRNGKRQHLWVHRLICEAFHGEPPIYGDQFAHVRHLDNDPTNNNADNLRWGTKEENEADKQMYKRRY